MMPLLADEAPEVIRRLVVAVNEKKLVPETVGPLF